MFIKPLRLAIQFLLIVILSGLLLVLSAQSINLKEGFYHLENYINTHTTFLLIFRCFVYGLGFFLWPYLVRRSIPITKEQIKTLISARNYLLIAALFQELLNWWR